MATVTSTLLRVAVTALVGAAAIGCGPSNEFMEDAEWSKDRGNERGAWREVESLFGKEESDVDRFRGTLRGVRHDVTMHDEAKSVSCPCLEVAVGRPRSGKFKWSGRVPGVGPRNEVVAISTQDSVCEGAGKGVRRPSIRAVDRVRGDVIVVIEELPFERPQALGAIVPRPDQGRSLYVRQRRRKLYKGDKGRLPYAGIGTRESPMCKIYSREQSRNRMRIE